MDFSLINIFFALAAGELGLYLWEESKIDQLEKRRKIRVESVIEDFTSRVGPRKQLGSSKSELADLIFNIYECDRDAVMPIISLMPHKKIAVLLIASFVSSLTWGLVEGGLLPINQTLIDFPYFKIDLLGIMAFISISCWSVSIYLAFIETKYVIRMTTKMRNHNKTE
ncbi:MAG: hypothetical protein ACSHX4_04055 [Opitutaceae bacterium]